MRLNKSSTWWCLPFGLVVVVIDFVMVSAAENNSTTHRPNCPPKPCQRNADSERPACGTDGLTYPNRCHLEMARCAGVEVALAKRGACRTLRSCSEWNTTATEGFVPACRRDGTYDAAQCHPSTGWCWCVMPDGVPLPYTAVRRKNPDSKPRCGRKKAHRRSPAGGGKHRRGRNCKRLDKAQLNNNLITSFHAEYNRQNGGRNESDGAVVEWKFHMLDVNADEALDRFEYRDIRKVVKNAMKPKKCAKTFPKACDVNGDQRITKQEWADCLTRDGMDEGVKGQSSTDDATDDSEDYEDAGSFHPARTPPHGVLSSGMSSLQGFGGVDAEGVGEGTSSEGRDDADDPPDCLSDRRAALAEGSQQLYVPECTTDGRYQKIQCYKSAGYCWCVNEDTGKNIPGTSVKNGTPKCDQLKTSNKTMKGCPDEKKIIFLKDLLQFLHSKMSEIVSGNSTFTSLAWIASKEEQAATWSFVVFDKNKNKKLEKHEWKAFKDLVGTVKGLRKCGKRLPRYCDSNKDKDISMTEWLECLNIQQLITTSSNTPISPRAGKTNPLTMLKDD